MAADVSILFDQLPASVKVLFVVGVVLLAADYVVLDDCGQVAHGSFDQLGGDCGRVLHGWRGVDLYQPHPEVLVDHEIVAEHLEAVLAVLHVLQDALQRLVDHSPHLRLYHFPVDLLPAQLLQFGREGLLVHHVAGDAVVLEVDALGD